MGQNTRIDWATHTFNPWWGCTKVSAGCEHCYAEGVANRFAPGLWGPHGRRRFFGDRHWAEPLKWNRRAEKRGVRERVFCGSMCDVFEWQSDHPDWPEQEWSWMRLGALINKTPNLDWLLLTKRPENICEFTRPSMLPPNVWLGVTAENQAAADERIPLLLQVPAAVRFVSCEPLLSEIDLSQWVSWNKPIGKLSWIIAGAESGHGARPADERWFRSLKGQCVVTGVPYFLKQMRVNGKLVKLPELDGRAWDQLPNGATK